MSHMVIANRLHDGLVVFLAADGSWVDSIARGWLAEDEPDRTRALQRSMEAQYANQVIGPDLIEVTEQHGVRMPVSIREAIRAAGPTVQTGRNA
ncbi:MAG: DUF2849 domain-containing protein [Gammaproteobacteria bacterium]|nr:DUF2849 domain-containing protein [Gammaproteobacteria bacterium]